MNAMIGHNVSGTALHQLNSAVAGLGLALQDARTIRRNDRAQMVLVARYLVEVDHAAADNEELADAEVRAAGVILPSDLLSNGYERAWARWLARGGVLQSVQAKTPNEINDLSAGSLNPLEARFLTGKKFAKVTTYTSINAAVTRECKAEIRDAMSGREDAASIDAVRTSYADLFKAETIEAWIKDEEYRRSDEYARIQDLKKAWALRVEEAIEEAQRDNNTQAFERLEAQVKAQLARIRALAAEKRAEVEAKANAPKLSSDQRKLVEDSMRRGADMPEAQGMTDEDF